MSKPSNSPNLSTVGVDVPPDAGSTPGIEVLATVSPRAMVASPRGRRVVVPEWVSDGDEVTIVAGLTGCGSIMATAPETVDLATLAWTGATF